MLIAHSLAELAALPHADRPAVVTIGNFDGVHLGHQKVIGEVRASAQRHNARSVVVTFDPHPSLVLQNGPRTPLITQLPQKLDLLAQTGVDVTLVLPFNDELRTRTARQFARQVLCDALHTLGIHEGETFRFGHRAEADIAGLTELGAELRFAVHAYQPLLRRGGPVSSSRIRALVAAGELSTARALLGRPFALNSTPAPGRGYGTRYAVPTINLATSAVAPADRCPDLLPAHGVYATLLQIGTGPDALHFQGVTNAGNRPTFGADSFAIETHLFDFSPVDLTETTPLQLTFLHRLRAERRFSSPEALKAQIGLDVNAAQRFFGLCRRLCQPVPHGQPCTA